MVEITVKLPDGQGIAVPEGSVVRDVAAAIGPRLAASALAEDALDALDSYLEKAYMSGMPFVRIIHGKGTGRLRQVIGEALRASPHVRKYEMGGEKEGGDGVTVAHLRED